MRTPQLYRSPAADDYLSRWKRIIHLDTRLRAGGWPSATVLARECGVSTKTIYRDLEALKNELAAPIRYDARKRGFAYHDAGYAIPAAALTERDLFALMVAENAVEQYEGTPLAGYLRAAFAKVLAVLPGELRAKHELAARAIHFSGLPPCRIRPDLWSELTTAIQSHQRVELTYFAPARRATEPREVEPYLLVVRDREWFLVARTLQSRNFALFYLPRVRRAKRVPTFFEPDPAFDAASYYEHGFNAMHGSGAPSTVELHFAAADAHLAEERGWAPKQTLTQHRDGSATVRFRTNTLFEVERAVLRYGGRIEVRAPAALRRAVLEAAERIRRAHA